MKKIYLFIFIFILGLSSFCYAKVNIPETIRIGIYSTTSSVSSFTISSDSGMEIGTVNSKGKFELIDEIAAKKQITIKKGSKANTVSVEGIGDVGDADNFLRIIPMETSGIELLNVNGNRYRGEIEVRRINGSDMTVINELGMEEYLYGVVPREIGGNSPIEAVKAQAIIARTYAAKNYTKRNNFGFNLKNNTEDQAYGGYDWENKNSNKAVDDTRGMVAVYDGELIGGYYFSTSGGYTESSENVWGGEVDYLEAVPDPYEPTDLARTTWVQTFSASDIEKKLADRGVNIGKVVNMYVTDFSDAGRALELKIVGTNGEKTYSKSNIRSFLNLYSQWFTINDDAPEVPKSSVKVNKEKETDDVIVEEVEEGDRIVVEEPKPLISKLVSAIKNIKSSASTIVAKNKDKTDNDVEEKKAVYGARSNDYFELKGRGWGHSVGMSQNGAIGMAKNDFSAEEIIKWYYQGVSITK